MFVVEIFLGNKFPGKDLCLWCKEKLLEFLDDLKIVFLDDLKIETFHRIQWMYN